MGQLVQLSDYRSAAHPVRQQQTRARLDWVPADLELALDLADNGDMRDAADLVETLCTDDRIRGVVDTRTLGMLALPLSFADGDPELADMLRRTAESGGFGSMFPEEEAAALMRWGLVLGVGFARKVPTYSGGVRSFRIETWHPRAFTWRENEQCWYVNHADGQCRVDAGDGWIIYTPHGTARPWASGMWRGLAFAWVLKQFALLDRSRHAESTGSPIRVGIAPEGATEGQRERFRQILARINRDAAIVIPNGWSFALVEATARTWEIYTAQVEWADRAIATIIAGQPVTTEGSSGFSEGKIQAVVARGLIRFTAKTFSLAIHAQGLVGWGRANFPGRVVPQPSWDAESNEERLEKARALISAGEAISKLDGILAPSGYRVDALHMMESLGVRTIALPPNKADAPTLKIAPTELGIVITVNEARASAGIGPLKTPAGQPDPDGFLTVSEFAAKREAKTAAGAAPNVPGADSGAAEVARATQEREAQAAVTP